MERNNGQKVYKIVMLVMITIIITSLVTAYGTYQYLNTKGLSIGKNQVNSELKGLEYTLARFRSELEKKYMGEIEDEDLIDGAIKGYVADSPAEKAGILQGDLIIKVDGEGYTGDKMEEASNKIKGESGTKVKLEILRNGETKEFEITRKKVLISHITTKVIDNNIGYIAISDFDGGCADEFETKYQKLKEKGINKLIIDIRSNGGGIVDEAIDILDLITDKGSTLLITKDKKGNEDITKAKQNPIIKMPIVVLTNEYSASASEILAGALKDNEKATLVGRTTYGKGVIQELHQLTDGSGLKITTNEYFTPKRNSINKIGIEPDVEVDLSDKAKESMNLKEEDDNQLQKAIEVLKSKN